MYPPCVYENLLIQATTNLVLSAVHGLNQTIQNDGKDDDGKAGCESFSCLVSSDGSVDFCPKPFRSDHGSDDHHGQCQHDGLVHALHDGVLGQWNLYLEELLSTSGPEGIRRF